MNRTFLVLASLTALLIAFVLYRSCSPGNHLNVDPQAAEEIENAKRR